MQRGISVMKASMEEEGWAVICRVKEQLTKAVTEDIHIHKPEWFFTLVKLGFATESNKTNL